MAPKHMLVVVLGSFLTLGVPVSASEYRAGELFNLDLSRAVLSPKRMGPPAEFVSVPVQARTDAQQVVSKPEVGQQRADRKTSAARTVSVAKNRPGPGTKLARSSNPLDAKAMDTRIQRWPCKSGGICSWKR